MSSDLHTGSDADPAAPARILEAGRDPQTEVASETYTETTADEQTLGLAGPPIPGPPRPTQRSGVYRLVRPVILPPRPAMLPRAGGPQPEQALGPPQALDPSQALSNGAADAVEPDQGIDEIGPLLPLMPKFGTEELRVDIDGLMPTMTVSGTIVRLIGGRLTWIAQVAKDPATGDWKGPISYRDGTTSLRPHTNVSVKLTGGPFLPASHKAIARFSGGSAAPVTLTYKFERQAFREVEFEYDTVSDATAVTTHNPTSHPNHPVGLPNSTLSLESAYSRLGIRVTKTGGDSVIPIDLAGSNTTWSDQEMHDAMQVHWSRWADAPQWAVWVLFARLHDQGTSLGGIMFDDIGTAQRQGTSIFSDSFISQAPAGEANPGPYVERMRFWTAMHEIGHAFNLAHAWQKSLGTSWVPLTDEPAALSFMNYPYFYPGGVDAFFAAFEYGFSPDELLFLRHAPERLVKMGAEPWFSNHGFETDAFEQLRDAVSGPFELEVRVHREPRFEFLEPVVVELRLRNVSSTPVVADGNALGDDSLAIVVSRDGGEPKRWLPFARYCMAPDPTVLQPGEAMYSSLFLSAGTGGWLVSEPGRYTVYAAIDLGSGSTAISQPLTIAVEPPSGSEAERLADDVFSQEVAHVLAFGGSRVLDSANETLQEVAERLPESQAAVHASAALGTPLAADGKVLTVGPEGREVVDLVPAEPAQARELLSAALADFDKAADSLGHIAVAVQTERLADVMAAEGDHETGADLLNRSADALARRGVLPGVVEALRQQSRR